MNLIGKRKEMARKLKREEKLARKRAKLKPTLAKGSRPISRVDYELVNAQHIKSREAEPEIETQSL
jgi:hypothetical protein